jgi:hypothetical protein
MSRSVPFDPEAICDSCGKKGATDFMGDELCNKCAFPKTQIVPATDVEKNDTIIALIQSNIENWKRAEAAEAKVVQLEAWKQSQISVTPDYQKIGKLLDVGLGQSVHDKIIPGILALQEALKNARVNVLAEIHAYQKKRMWDGAISFMKKEIPDYEQASQDRKEK